MSTILQDNWWFSPSGDDFSLRFRTNGNTPQLVHNVDPATTGAVTVSWWMKFTDVNYTDNQLIFRGDNVTPSSALQWRQSNQVMRLFVGGGSVDSQAVYRDPNAWYHVVISSNGTDRTRVWFNNRLDIESTSPFRLAGRMGWGNPNSNAGTNTGNPDNYWQGNLADCRIVDGQELEPTAFGEFDDNGVWTPINPTIVDYGVNGCYLDLKNPGNIGNDVAPISSNHSAANDFTPTGFELTDETDPDWDHQTDHPNTNYGILNPLVIRTKTVGVDGGPTAYGNAHQEAEFGTVTQWRTALGGLGVVVGREYFWEATIVNVGTTGRLQVGWTSPGAIEYSDLPVATPEIWYRQDAIFRIGVGGATSYGATWTTGDVIGCRLDLTGTGIVEFFKNGVSQGEAVNALVGNLDLSDVGGWTPMASPNNTDPAGSSGAIVDFNFGQRPWRFPQGIEGYAASNKSAIPVPNGRDHFETLLWQGTGSGDAGFNSVTDTPGDFTDFLTCDSGGFDPSFPAGRAFDGDNATAAQSLNAGATISYTPTGGQAFAVSLAVRTSFANQRARLNGGAWVNLTQNAVNTLVSGSGTINLLEIQATSGVSALSSVELDTFRLTDVGILIMAQQTVFENAFWLIKDRVNNNVWQYVNRFRLNQAGSDVCNPTPGQPNIEQAYVSPAGNSVAYCWNAPTSMSRPGAPNFNIPTNGFVDNDAGFSLFQFSGNGQNGQTMLTGLTGRVDMVWFFKLTGNTAGGGGQTNFMAPAVYHRSLGASDFLMLHSSEQSNTGGCLNQDPQGQSPGAEPFLNISGANANGTNNGWNLAGDDYMVYCWARREGYSHFGEYEGNSSTDGPFIYTGFRPALVIVKATNSNQVWQICDATINPDNPVNTSLNFDEEIGETTFARFDFLSNGFKCINSATSSNNTGTNYIYAAFAENPFGGSNVQPVTAR